ncbi:MAG TPA: hypothetical protein VME46_20870 [Acidimicrobiales bacterium]|nr:hypothetical protein [Acidimicrobiales bacterium]
MRCKAVGATLLLVGTLVVTTGASAGVAGAASSGTAESPAGLVKAALAAADAQSSVHWVSKGKVGGASIVITTQAGQSDGYQTYVISEQSASAELAEADVGQTCFVNGDAVGLEAVLNFKSTPAAAEAGKWLSDKPGGPEYQEIAAGLTLSTTMAPLEMQGTVKALPGKTIAGHRVLAVRGNSEPFEGNPSVPETLYVAATGKMLPVEAVQEESKQLTVTIDFSRWGSPVQVQAPSGAVAIQKSWITSSK